MANITVLSGYVQDDFKTGSFDNRIAFLNFSLSYQRQKKVDGIYTKTTCYIQVNLYNSGLIKWYYENDLLKKGAHIQVTGELGQEIYKNKDDVTVRVTRIQGNHVDILENISKKTIGVNPDTIDQPFNKNRVANRAIDEKNKINEDDMDEIPF